MSKMQEILVIAEQDRAIRCALLMLKDIVNMASVLGGTCHISAGYFAQKYNYNPRTFFRHKQCLIKHGYIREKSRWQVEVIMPNHQQAVVVKCDKKVAINDTKKSDIPVKNTDNFVEKNDTNVIQKQINKKTKDKRGAISSFIALPQNLNPFDNLCLTQAQFDKLIAKHTAAALAKELPRASAWLVNNPTKWKNHYAGLCNWLGSSFLVQKCTPLPPNPYATASGNW